MSWQREEYKKMKGAILYSVLRDDDVFGFKTSKGPFWFTVEGDCCSTSFVESIEVSPGACGAEIVSVDESSVDTPPGTDTSKYDVLSCYNLRIQTTRGDVVVDFRNDSNGYYGGNVTGYGRPNRAQRQRMKTIARMAAGEDIDEID